MKKIIIVERNDVWMLAFVHEHGQMRGLAQSLI